MWRYQGFARKLTWYFIGVYIINIYILSPGGCWELLPIMAYMRGTPPKMGPIFILQVYERVGISLASHAGIFRGAQLSSSPTNACSAENNIPFPSLANHFALSKFWPWTQGNAITQSAWNTGKAFWPLINVRFRAAKVRFSPCTAYLRKEGRR